MKKYIYLALAWGILSTGFTSCLNDEIDTNNFVVTDKPLVASFLQGDPQYSEFVKLMDAVNVTELLNTYGYYTCFAPTNEALNSYYAKRNTSFDQLTPDEKAELVYNHVISGRNKDEVYESALFSNGPIQSATLSGRFVYISSTFATDSVLRVYVNDSAAIRILDQEVHNGVVHTINKVLQFSNTNIADAVTAVEDYSLFCEALQQTHVGDSLRGELLNKAYEEVYKAIADPNKKIQSKHSSAGNPWVRVPKKCEYGFTIFVESNQTLKSAGINSLDDLKHYASEIYDVIYPEDQDITDLTDRRNSLNRFVSYHILDRTLAASEFIHTDRVQYYTSGTQIYDYFETLCPNTMMEVTQPPQSQSIVFNMHIGEPETGIRLVSGKTDQQAVNGVFHEIDRILTYQNVEEKVLNKRIRIDLASMMPEFSTNKMRLAKNGWTDGYIIPQKFCKNLTFSNTTQFAYIGSAGYANFESDEFIITDKYDFTLRTPPIPKGTYEVRVGYAANSRRGVSQIYFDGMPCGIPLDMRLKGTDPGIGWMSKASCDAAGITLEENDKAMHNRGYMKGPNNVLVFSRGSLARDYDGDIRRIIITKYMDKTEPHFIRYKTVMEDHTMELQIDYIEFAPSNIWETEGQD